METCSLIGCKTVKWEVLGVECHLREHLLGLPPLNTKDAGEAVVHTEAEKAKYAHLDRAYQFQPIAVETCGAVSPDSMCFLHNLGRRLKSATGEPNSFIYLLQLVSVAIQVGNLTSVLGSLPDFGT